MSKKSKKTSASTLVLASSCLAALFGVIAIFLPFADFIKGTITVRDTVVESATYQGTEFIFGENANTGCLVAWILVLAGSIIILLAFLWALLSKKHLKPASLVLLLGSIALLVGGIMYFCFIPMTGLQNGDYSVIGWKFSLEFPAILGGLCGALGGLLGASGSLVALLKK